MIRIPIAALATLLSIGAAAAQQLDNTLDPKRPVLKSEATVTGPIVRIGDLVENAGIIAKVPIFRAPERERGGGGRGWGSHGGGGNWQRSADRAGRGG